MKVAVVYNRESRSVINLFGLPNRERYGLKAIRKIVQALKDGGHQAVAMEGDKDLISNLENFMPRVLKGERPGLVFNLSYGIQGQARYTHVPGILEMVGIPYVGSGPLAHSLALDKVVAKVIFRQNGLPTPDFSVLDAPGFPMPPLSMPVIVKPKNEAVSFGIRVVHNESEFREAADNIFQKFAQPVLAEEYIDGREINVGLLGNSPPLAFQPAELLFGADGPKIYTYEDKTHRSGRSIEVVCPADLTPEASERARAVAVQAFTALGCYDCARVDMRLDGQGNLYILEINSLPSLGEHGSYVAAANSEGMDFSALVNRLVEVASARYFGTPSPPSLVRKPTVPEDQVFAFLSQSRDTMEQRLEKWCSYSSRTTDMVGRHMVVKEFGRRLDEILMRPVPSLTNDKVVWTWESRAGLDGGTLLVTQIDIPFETNIRYQGFRRDPEWFYGDGIGIVWAPLTLLEFALRALRSTRRLRSTPIGVLCYGDEGLDCRYSSEIIRAAAERAGRVIVLRPANPGGNAIVERRGQRKYFLLVEGRPQRLGRVPKHPEVLQWVNAKVDELSSLTVRRERLALSATDIRCEAFPMLLPHRVTVTLLSTFPTKKAGDLLEEKMRKVLGRARLRWDLELVSDRPPMRTRKQGSPLVEGLARIAESWEIPFGTDSSVWPSVAGLVRPGRPVICGMGPVAHDLYTSKEAVERNSLIQRTLLLAQYLVGSKGGGAD